MKKQNVRTLALIVCTFTYLLVGAAIFDTLESKHELKEKTRLEDTENEIISKYNMSAEDFHILRRTVLVSRPYKAGIQWKFAGAFYFALSVITTIGYGHITPRTLGGKIFCVCYALIGIPLNIVMFQSIGERFNIGTTFLLRRIKKCCRFREIEVTQTELTILGALLCAIVLVGGAAAFHYFEDWQFTDAFYFCFITMSTIGFGDYVALQNETVAALQTQPEYVAFCIIYILFGLTVFAAALNLMVLRLLTMNTVDERKDELEALAAARRAPRLDGDVILSNANGHIHSNTHSSSHLMENASLSMHEMEELPTPIQRHRKLSPLHQSDSRRVILPQRRESTVQEELSSLTLEPPESIDEGYAKVIVNLTKRKFSNSLNNKFRRKLHFPKFRYTARQRPCASVNHLLPMQASGTPLLQRRHTQESPISEEIFQHSNTFIRGTTPSEDLVIANTPNGSVLPLTASNTEDTVLSTVIPNKTVTLRHSPISMTRESGQMCKYTINNGHTNQSLVISPTSPIHHSDDQLQKRFSC